jgi:hypothetical protein
MNSIKDIQEGNVLYSVNCDKFNPIIITVKNIITNNEKEVVYELEYPNAIFGYDCNDTAKVNSILDNLINELQTE